MEGESLEIAPSTSTFFLGRVLDPRGDGDMPLFWMSLRSACKASPTALLPELLSVPVIRCHLPQSREPLPQFRSVKMVNVTLGWEDTTFEQPVRDSVAQGERENVKKYRNQLLAWTRMKVHGSLVLNSVLSPRRAIQSQTSGWSGCITSEMARCRDDWKKRRYFI